MRDFEPSSMSTRGVGEGEEAAEGEEEEGVALSVGWPPPPPLPLEMDEMVSSSTYEGSFGIPTIL